MNVLGLFLLRDDTSKYVDRGYDIRYSYQMITNPPRKVTLKALSQKEVFRKTSDEALLRSIKSNLKNGRFTSYPDPETAVFFTIASSITLLLAGVGWLISALSPFWGIWIIVGILGAVPAFFMVGLGLTLIFDLASDYKYYRSHLAEARRRNLVE